MKKFGSRKSGKNPIFEFPALTVPPWLHPTTRNYRHAILSSWAIIWTYHHIILRFVTVKIFWPYPRITLKNLTKHGFDTSCDSADGEVEATNWIPSETISTALNDDCLRAKGLVDILKNSEMGLDTKSNVDQLNLIDGTTYQLTLPK